MSRVALVPGVRVGGWRGRPSCRYDSPAQAKQARPLFRVSGGNRPDSIPAGPGVSRNFSASARWPRRSRRSSHA